MHKRMFEGCKYEQRWCIKKHLTHHLSMSLFYTSCKLVVVFKHLMLGKALTICHAIHGSKGKYKGDNFSFHVFCF